MKKMASYPFILNSEEFLCFSRPTAGTDIEKTLGKLPEQTPQQVLERLAEALEVADHMYNPIQLNALGQESDEFKNFAR